MKRLTDVQKIEIVEKYQTGKYTCVQLGREYGITGSSIGSLLKTRNIQINNDQTKLQRKYTLQEDYFDKIDTEDKAYFLGWLYSDGCNYPKLNRVFIAIQAEDKEILNRLNNFIGSNRPLLIKAQSGYGSKDIAELNINSKRISESLLKLGCIAAKSLTLKFPTEEQVPSYLIRHFIRGYFDGDGSVGAYKPTRGKIVLKTKTVSTENVCIGIQKNIQNRLNIYGGIASPNGELEKSTRQLTTHSTISSYKFLSWMYYDTDLFLQRKFDKFIENLHLLVDKVSLDKDVQKAIQNFE